MNRQRLLAVPPKPPCSHQPLPGRTRGLQGPGCSLGAGLRPWQALPCPRLAPHPRADQDSAKRASVSPVKATLTGRGAHRPPQLQGSGTCLPTGEHAAGCPQVRLSHVSTLHLSGVRAPGGVCGDPGGNDCSSGQLPLRAGAGSRPSPLVTQCPSLSLDLSQGHLSSLAGGTPCGGQRGPCPPQEPALHGQAPGQVHVPQSQGATGPRTPGEEGG